MSLTVSNAIVLLLGIVLLASIAYSLRDQFMKTFEESCTQKNQDLATSGPQAIGVMASIPYWDQSRAISVFKNNVAHFDYVSLFWYHVSEGGEIQTYEHAEIDTALIDFAHEHNVKVLALIANLAEDGDWDPGLVDNVIRSEDARSAHIEDILTLVEENEFDGILIDYEFLRNRQTEDFSTFVEELGRALHKKGKLLSVAAHAQEPEGPTRGQDLATLSEDVDIISLMTYDEHWETGNPGPVASLVWVRSVLEHTKNLGVDMSKVFMGVPLYGYDWPEGKDGEGLEYAQILERAKKYGANIAFDTKAQSPYFNYQSDGTHTVWFENSKSFAAKLDLAQEFKVGGILFWRQGQEDRGIYEILTNTLRGDVASSTQSIE